MAHIRLVTRKNEYGLSVDIRILTEFLGANHRVEYASIDEKPVDYADVNIFLEMVPDGKKVRRVGQEWFDTARRNLLLPNHEWFFPEWAAFLPRFDVVLCKNLLSVEIFGALGARTALTGFASDDRLDPTVPREPDHFLHVAGQSRQKNTEAVLATWAANPGFPRLTVVRGEATEARGNVEVLSGHRPAPELRRLQNACAVHLCPSAVEGFGHYIMEALSVGALVLTTDVAPMNELVTGDRGVLCPFARLEPLGFCGLRPRHVVESDVLARAVDEILVMSQDERGARGAAARVFFEESRRRFGERINEEIAGIL